MKKIIAFMLLMCMILTLAGCNGNETTPPEDSTPEDTTPEITLQEVYDAGKSLSALLGDRESVYVQVIIDGNVVREEYLNNQYCYSYYSAEYMDMGFVYADFTTESGEYVYMDDSYVLNVLLSTSGMVDAKDRFDAVGNNGFISSEVLDDDTAAITEKDGSIIVTCTADVEEIELMGDDIVSCVETYTLDAKTHEMTSVKTVYTYADGTVEEGIANITRDVEAPEGAKPFMTYAQETENMRTVTIVSNPGTENEKTESIQVPVGLQVSVSSSWEVEEIYTLYSDAACTQLIEEDFDVNTDLTIYVKWGDWSDFYKTVYAQQLDRYYTAISEQWEESTYFDHEMSALASYYYEGNALDNVGFAFMDLDGDSINELIIGAIKNAEQDPIVFEIWTVNAEGTVMLAQSSARNRYYMQYAAEDDMWSVSYVAENGAANHAVYNLVLAEGEFEIIQGVIFDAIANENDPWFMTYDFDWDTSNDTPIDEDTANAVMEAGRNIYTAIEYISYSRYK